MNPLPQGVTLYVAPSNVESTSEAIRALPSKRMQFEAYHDGIYALSCPERELHELCLEWGNSLSKSELEAFRCRLMVGDERPSVGQLMHSQSLRQLIEWVEGQWLEGVLQSQRLVTYFQPIVQNDDPGRIFAHECLVRGREEDGRIISPAQLFNTTPCLSCSALRKSFDPSGAVSGVCSVKSSMFASVLC